MVRSFLIHAMAAAVLAAIALAQDAKPAVPPGRDPGGTAVALISTGIDYTQPGLAQRLARDGEGELIGWDLRDNDGRPFDNSRGDTRPAWGGDGTAIAALLVGAKGVRLVPIRLDPADPVSLARAVAFAAQTPARIVVLPMWSLVRADWEPLRQAAVRFKDVLIIAPALVGAEPAYPAALGLDTVLAVEPGPAGADAAGFGGRMQSISGPPLAVAAAGKAAADLLAREPRLDVAALKRRLIEAGGGPAWRARQ